MSNASSNSRTVQLQDRRVLGYAEFGDPSGNALLYFHGHPGSRFEAGFLAEEAARARVRLIGIDRPGMGLSSYKSGRQVLDWPKDVIELADALRLDRFSVLGFSGGAPYAVACACEIPDRLLACGIVSGVGHVGPFLSFLSQWLPWIIMPLTRRFFVDEERAERTLQRLASRWSDPDRQSFGESIVRKTMAASLVEAFRPGVRGPAYDGALLGRDWGFRLENIRFAAVDLWHGALDRETPEAAARATAEAIPHCKATYYSDESHISVIANHAPEIVGALRPGP